MRGSDILYFDNSDRKKSIIYANEDESSSLIFSLAYLLRMVYIKDYLKEKGIPLTHLNDIAEVWYNASRRSIKKYGFYGLNGVYRSFLYSYMKPARFTLGRLKFEINCLEDNYAVYKTDSGIVSASSDEPAPNGECILKRGDPVLYVHIPAKGRLSKESVDESFALAKNFFATYAFQNRFTIAAKSENSFSLYWHVFNIEDFLPPEQLVPTNDFQARILNYVKAGNKLFSGKGFILP